MEYDGRWKIHVANRVEIYSNQELTLWNLEDSWNLGKKYPMPILIFPVSVQMQGLWVTLYVIVVVLLRST